MRRLLRFYSAFALVLPLALVFQLWSLASCCIPATARSDAAWAPGGVLVICSGNGTTQIDVDDPAPQQDHGSSCAALCAMAALGLLVLLAVPVRFGRLPRLPLRSVFSADPRAPPLAYRSRAPPFLV
ncbi:hypothetical protein ACSMXM_08090 [Pacificimonas sp. ICDLI1SI03]